MHQFGLFPELGQIAGMEPFVQARIVETSSTDDLVADSSSAAFAPIISSAGTPLGVIAVFYRRTTVLTHPDHRRLRTAAIAAEAAIESSGG